MQAETGIDRIELRVDGGPTRNRWLMQFQSDMLDCRVMTPETEELSGMGAAYAAGLSLGIYMDAVFAGNRYDSFTPAMTQERRMSKYDGWKAAVATIL